MMESKIHQIEHSYFEVKRCISSLAAQYPFLNIKNIGRSSAGRDIQALTIGTASEYVLYLSSFNGMHRLMTLILLRFIEEFCDAVQNGEDMAGINIRRAMFGRGIIVVPMVNPDGHEITLRGEVGCGYMASKIAKISSGDYKHWCSNLRGVDLERNFLTGFDARRAVEKEKGLFGPAMKEFSGYKAESESETVAIAELCRSVPIRHVIQLSAYGETLCYGSGENIPGRSNKMAEIMSTVTGYAIDVPLTVTETGFRDWFIEEFGRPAFCVKVGNSGIPGVEKLEVEYERLKELLTLSALM